MSSLPRLGDRVRITEVGEYSAHHGIVGTLFSVGALLEIEPSPHRGWLCVALEVEGRGYLYCAMAKVETVAKAVA